MVSHKLLFIGKDFFNTSQNKHIMRDTMIKNPWGKSPFFGHWINRRCGDLRFLKTESGSVLAVRGQDALTECVTVNGCIEVLKERGLRKVSAA